MNASTAVLVSMTMALGGCSVFDLTPPPYRAADEVTIAGAEGLASNYLATYATDRESLANGPQLFELPVIAAGAAAAAALAFGGNTDILAGAGLGAGLAAVLSEYYAPRTRGQLYDGAFEAMDCLRGVASGVRFVDGSTMVLDTGTDAAVALVPTGVDRLADAATTLRNYQLGAGLAVAGSDVDASTPMTMSNELAAVMIDDAADLGDELASRARTAARDLIAGMHHVNARLAAKLAATAKVPTFDATSTALNSNLKRAVELQAEMKKLRESLLPAARGASPALAESVETVTALHNEALAELPADVEACLKKMD